MRNDLNFSEMNEFSICNENIESIFVEITCSNIPITVGVLYQTKHHKIFTYQEKSPARHQNIVESFKFQNYP